MPFAVILLLAILNKINITIISKDEAIPNQQ
jgi:hypothetical protein